MQSSHEGPSRPRAGAFSLLRNSPPPEGSMKAPGFDCDGAKRRKVVLGPKASRPWAHHFRQFLGCPRKDEGMTNHSSFDEEKAKELRRLERICRKWTYSFAGRLSGRSQDDMPPPRRCSNSPSSHRRPRIRSWQSGGSEPLSLCGCKALPTDITAARADFFLQTLLNFFSI